MSDIQEVDVLGDFGLTLDHFYGIVKSHAGTLEADQFLQLQLTAVPLDLSTDYKWFSYNNLVTYLDVRADPNPVSENLALLSMARLSKEYVRFLSDLLTLVEVKELDGETKKKIDILQAAINNRGSQIEALQRRQFDQWQVYADTHMIERGDRTVFTHWAQGNALSAQIKVLEDEQREDAGLMQAFRVRRYDDPSHQSIVEAYARATGPAARMRFPLYPDGEYEDRARFNVTYFASLPDNDSALFANRANITVPQDIKSITTGTLGSFSDVVTKQSSASSRITTDWSGRGGGRYGFFKVSAKISSHTDIKEDFKKLESITVAAKSLQALAMSAPAWFDPDMFSHPLVKTNRRLFDRYLGEEGTLQYYPTHLIIARGMSLKFTSSQDWTYDYAHDFSASGSASGKFFGIKVGGGVAYSRSERRAKMEKRGHDLIVDDGDNIRIIGYRFAKNTRYAKDMIEAFGPDIENAFL
jgi:hypothetical protein